MDVSEVNIMLNLLGIFGVKICNKFFVWNLYLNLIVFLVSILILKLYCLCCCWWFMVYGCGIFEVIIVVF